MNYLCHKNFQNNSEQLLKEHLHEVSRLSEKFASEFDESNIGKIVGLYHNLFYRLLNKSISNYDVYTQGIDIPVLNNNFNLIIIKKKLTLRLCFIRA